MSLSGSRLQSALATDILAQIQAAFPVNGSLLAPEQAACNTGQHALATALATAVGPDVVTEVKLGTVAVTGVTSGGSSAPGTIT